MSKDMLSEEMAKCTSRLYTAEQEVSRLERMVRISRLLSSTLDLPRLLQLIIHTAVDMLEVEAASILLEDDRTGELYFAAATGAAAKELRKIEVPMGGSIAGSIYASGEPAIVEDVLADPRHYRNSDEQAHFETRAILGVPLRVGDIVIGVLEAVNKLDSSHFDDKDTQILQTLAAQAAIAIYNARLVTELREANVRLAELDKVRSDFLTIASHELRTPLAIVLGYAALLQEQTSEGFSDQAKALLRGARRLQGIIKSITNLSYLESGKVELAPSRVILQELLENICDDWEPLLAGKHQQLRRSFPSKPIPVVVDRDRIVTALGNLFNNAVEFTPTEGLIEVAIRPQTGKVAVSVTDTGVGIPPDELERVFEPFYQVEDPMKRRHQGIGLGLSVARQIVELHGGRIWAESVKDRGSRFTFTLPLAQKARRQESRVRSQR